MPSDASHAARSEGGASLGLRDAIGLLVAFGCLGLLVYRSALGGPFVSDDPLYYVHNPYTQGLGAENLWAILDPTGPARLYAYNYAPLHLLMVAAELQLFGAQMLGYHLVNLLLHVLNSTLLVVLLLSSGVPRIAAVLGGALFCAHPANVEAVAWISQLKSVACLALGLGALLVLRRRPGGSALLFAASLLTKFSAVALLPMAALLAWTRGYGRRSWMGLGAWLAALVGVSAAQLATFGGGGSYGLDLFADRAEQLRSIAALGARYLWMAATGTGLSTYHEPDPSRSWWDPGWWAGLALGALLTWRVLATLLRREDEAAWWVCAAAAFVPISQLVPFRFPLADRYLYFMLPGLIGGVTLAGLAARRRLGLESRFGDAAPAIGAAALVALFSLQAAARAPVWTHDRNLLVDAARHYPQGSHGYLLRALRAAQRGDADKAVAELRAGEERKRLSLVRDFANDPLFEPIRGHPLFREFVRETARFRIELVRQRGMLPGEELVVALKHATLGEFEAAIELVEQALRNDSSRREDLLLVLEDLRARLRETDTQATQSR